MSNDKPNWTAIQNKLDRTTICLDVPEGALCRALVSRQSSAEVGAKLRADISQFIGIPANSVRICTGSSSKTPGRTANLPPRTA